MSSRPNRRRSSGQTYGGLPPAPKQRYFTPKLRSIMSRPSTSSTTRKKQQTITQMDPFHALYHPELGDDLAYDEAIDATQDELPPKKRRRKPIPIRGEETLTEDAYASRSEHIEEEPSRVHGMDDNHDLNVPSPRNKRRKTMPNGPTRTVQTRSAKRKAVLKAIEGDEDAAKTVEPLLTEKPQDNLSDMAAALMPPPKTPKSSRRKEIPSSQSPADTPLSTQSRRSWREKSKSPLKEKSTNIPKYFRSPRKNVGQIPRLVIADSMDGARCTDSTASASPDFKNTTRTTHSRCTVTSAVTSQGGFAVRDQDSISIQPNSSNQMIHSRGKQAEIVRSEILDSDGEDSDGNLADSGVNFGLIPQPARLAVASTSSPGPFEHPLNHSAYQNHRDDGIGSEKACVPLPPYSNNEPELPKDNFVDQLHKSYGSRAHDNPHPRSESEEASAQLTAEFIRTTQPPPLVETDSQWEATWRPYSGPQEPRDYDQPNDEEPSSSSSARLPALIATPVPRSQTPPTSSPIHLPPSQATTVDITQPSNRLLFSSARRRSHPLPNLSSPPPLPATFSSSPFRTRKDGEAYMGFIGGWDGERLTDSQLLPESLMNDSMPGPPSSLLMEEGWEGEEG